MKEAARKLDIATKTADNHIQSLYSKIARIGHQVGPIADQTGPLSFVGLANANVPRMVIHDINAKGGLLGRPLELYLEDSATIDSTRAGSRS